MQSTRGILRPYVDSPEMSLARVPPAPELAYFVDYHWSVRWDLAEPTRRETLPFPSVHLAIEPGRCGVFGLSSRRFTVDLAGSGCVYAVKFRPGAFRPFLGEPVSRLTDGHRSLREVFGAEGERLQEAVLSTDPLEARIALTERFLLDRLPDPDPTIAWVNRVIEQVAADRSLTRVEQLVERFGTSKRTLQRTFADWVGASPKWVIQRYRLQEAAERLAREGASALSRLALDLGYADQAHFGKDFRAMIGVPPAEYARSASPPQRTPDSHGTDA